MPMPDVAMSRRRLIGSAIAAAFALRPAKAQTAPAVLLARGPVDRPEVALTFDCGSDRGHADLILDTLDHCLGNRTHAAKILGISIRTLRNKLGEYTGAGIAVPEPGQARLASA